MGLRSSLLQVAGAFHSPLMQPAADRLAEALEQTDITAPKSPVISNVTAEPHGDDTGVIKQRLVEQVTHPVRWEQSMRWVGENLVGDLVELAPGHLGWSTDEFQESRRQARLRADRLRDVLGAATCVQD